LLLFFKKEALASFSQPQTSGQPMCSIILRIAPEGVFIAANRDEMVNRPWQPPAEYWPGIVAGRDSLAGGTWLGLNRSGVAAAVLNRTGTLGPAAGKRSRGELPLLALRHATAEAAAAALEGLDAGGYRSFNLVLADSRSAILLVGLEAGRPKVVPLTDAVTMITSGAPNDLNLPRIARHLPIFQATPFEDWGKLLADRSGTWEETLNIPEKNGYATVCSSLIALPRKGAATWKFAAAPLHIAGFAPVMLP
jgi:uncharacterized protein with NRDE domain